ncbi:hypothetical protein Csa_010728 [Cucumis sativus]|uniref:Uncharacterized protein n=1 Tax=Cucumis sativus TaxID=3659 RepID=A0A0A0L735_CUCSA|nr:hypothetical protein Csa_010728 [Cucumis sativus]
MEWVTLKLSGKQCVVPKKERVISSDRDGKATTDQRQNNPPHKQPIISLHLSSHLALSPPSVTPLAKS